MTTVSEIFEGLGITIVKRRGIEKPAIDWLQDFQTDIDYDEVCDVRAKQVGKYIFFLDESAGWLNMGEITSSLATT